MKFGFTPILLLSLLVIIAGAFAFLVFTHVPVKQQEIIVNVPAGGAAQ